MVTRFIGKKLHKKVVRPMKNSVKHKNLAKRPMASADVDAGIHELGKANETMVDESDKSREAVVETSRKVESPEEIVVGASTKKENKRQKKSDKMIDENKLDQLEAISGTGMAKLKVKIEKADKGLYERTENSTILLTEDNKMLLND